MPKRIFAASLIACSILTASVWGQAQPASNAPAASTGAPGAAAPTAGSVPQNLNDLSGPDFAKREQALKRLQALVADQLKQRAQIQELLTTLTAELAQQQHDLGMVSDQEAQAKIAGLLEVERGLAGWTIQTMSEPADKRQAILDWGLTPQNAPLLAQLYGDSLRMRIAGLGKLIKLKGAGSDWTLARLIGDRTPAVRAAAMAAAWSREPSVEVVDALWYRAVAGPQALSDSGGSPHSMEAQILRDLGGIEGDPTAIKIDFPGGDPLMFGDSDDSPEFFDALLAENVLVHLNHPLVEAKVKALVAQQIKNKKSLCLGDDITWAQTTHRLVEAYKIKDAIPLLAAEALDANTDDIEADFNDQSYSWSRRSLAIGTLAKLIDKDPHDFGLVRIHDEGDSRNWIYGTPSNRNGGEGDGPAVRAFFAFWKDHHAEFGVAEAPSGDNVPKPGQKVNDMPGLNHGRPMPVDFGPGGNTPEGGPVPDGGPAPDAPAPPAVRGRPRG